MTRTITNLWLDFATFLIMIGLVLTGGLLHFVLPPFTGHSRQLFGLGRHDYGTIHFWLAVAALILLALHIVLHWSCVCSVVAKSLGKEKPGSRTQLVWGVGTLAFAVLLPVLVLFWASAHVEESTVLHRGQGRPGMSEAFHH